VGAIVVPREEPYDAKLFDALRRWRRKLAEKMQVPPYLIYPDKTLKELSRVKPQTEAELLEVRGIGPAKASQFGDETLALIQRHTGE
jgi:ATP-dependent DNA helicase RecQ